MNNDKLQAVPRSLRLRRANPNEIWAKNHQNLWMWSQIGLSFDTIESLKISFFLMLLLVIFRASTACSWRIYFRPTWPLTSSAYSRGAPQRNSTHKKYFLLVSTNIFLKLNIYFLTVFISSIRTCMWCLPQFPTTRSSTLKTISTNRQERRLELLAAQD